MEEEFQERYTGTYLDQHNEKWMILKLNSTIGVIEKDKYATAMPNSYELGANCGVLFMWVEKKKYTVSVTDMGFNLTYNGEIIYTLTRV